MNNQRIFIGIYPAGIVYADRTVEIDGDYARLAFLPYSTLELEFSRTCPAELKSEIRDSAALIQAKRGQAFRISECGQSVMLGGLQS
ncbi:MAG: hypothetical protein RB191_07390 [Terriglobia bacterium]|nr:hypothetical protein [Terriglobia bacterium]